jgi:hypothetical protein
MVTHGYELSFPLHDAVVPRSHQPASLESVATASVVRITINQWRLRIFI